MTKDKSAEVANFILEVNDTYGRIDTLTITGAYNKSSDVSKVKVPSILDMVNQYDYQNNLKIIDAEVKVDTDKAVTVIVTVDKILDPQNP